LFEGGGARGSRRGGVSRGKSTSVTQVHSGWELLRGRPHHACAVTSFEDCNYKKGQWFYVNTVLFLDENKPSKGVAAHLLSSWRRLTETFSVDAAVYVTVISDLCDPIRGLTALCIHSSNGHDSFNELCGSQVVLKIRFYHVWSYACLLAYSGAFSVPS